MEYTGKGNFKDSKSKVQRAKRYPMIHNVNLGIMSMTFYIEYINDGKKNTIILSVSDEE